MTKAQKIVSIIFACLFASISLFAIVWYLGDNYGSFYARATKEFAILGLDEGYTPQGLCYEKESNLFLTCGYMKNGSPSRIYVVDETNSENNKYFTLKNGEEDYCGHAGGITTNGTYVWLVGDGKVSRFSFEKVKSAENGEQIQIIDSFESGNGADFITIQNNLLWVGEFHREKKYDTDESHFIKTSNGKTNKALSLAYEIDNSNEYGIANLSPVKALSTGSLVQGMLFTEEKILLSTSYSLPNSHIYFHSNITNEETTKTFNFNGNEIPLYILEDSNLVESLEAPCMSEEIELVGNKVYIMFESACQKYGLFTREALKNVYSIKI